MSALVIFALSMGAAITTAYVWEPIEMWLRRRR